MSIVSDKYRGTKEYYLIHSELITAARYKGTITYQEIAQIIGLPLRGGHMAAEIGHLLGEISEDEFNAGRPMLSSIAVNVQRFPGPGFFKLARSLGKLSEESKQAENDFWEEESEAVYGTWKVVLKE